MVTDGNILGKRNPSTSSDLMETLPPGRSMSGRNRSADCLVSYGKTQSIIFFDRHIHYPDQSPHLMPQFVISGLRMLLL